MQDASARRRRPVGRPALAPEAIDARVAAYCQRYGVSAGDSGLPPFPSGRRETRQHREWLAIYRAKQRHDRRNSLADEATARERRDIRAAGPLAAGDLREPDERSPAVGLSGSPGSGRCAVCGQRLPSKAESFVAPDGRALRLHVRCAELARHAADVGQDAVRRVLQLLWPE